MENTSLIRTCAYKKGPALIDPHFHNAHEILFVEQGWVKLKIDETVYEAAAGSVLLISRLEEHEVVACSPDYARYYLTVRAEKLEQQLSQPQLMNLMRNRPEGFRHCLDVRGCAGAVSALLGAVCAEFASPGLFSETLCNSLLETLLVLLCRTAGQTAQSEGQPAVRYAQQYLEKHFASPLSMTALAREVYLTPGYLSHIFKAETGYSPKQYLMKCRLAHAKELLGSSSLPVKDVAYRAGFSDLNNFIRSFKTAAGITPLQYRAQCKNR